MSRVVADSVVTPEGLPAGSGAPAPRPGWLGSRRLLGAALPIAVFVAALGLYLSTLSKHYSEGEDSARYVICTTRPSSPADLYQPNHLAFIILNRFVYTLAQAAGYSGDAALPMKAISAGAGAFALWVMLRIMRRLGVDDQIAPVWAAITAVSFAYWSYSTQADTYTLPLPVLLLSVLAVIDLADGPFAPRKFAWLGLFNALTTLMQQVHIIIYPLMIAAAVAIWYRRRSEVPVGRLVVGLTVFGTVSAVIVGMAYFAVALGPLGMKDLRSIIRWSEGNGGGGAFSPVKWSNPLVSLIAIGHAMLGGHFLFGFDWFYDPFVRRFPHKLLIEERYLALQLPVARRLACLTASGIAAVSGLAFLAPLLSRCKSAHPGRPRSLRFFACDVIVWPILLMSFVFNTIMEPTTIEWWVGPIPIAAVAIASLQARRPTGSRWWPAGVIFAASLFFANGAGCILPQSELRTDYWYKVNGFLIRNARPGDTILTDGGFISDNYLNLYTGADVIPVHAVRCDRLARILSGPYGGRLWVSSWAFEPPAEVLRTGQLATNRPGDPDVVASRAYLKGLCGRMVRHDESPAQQIWELLPP
jgi:hypothetical protein